MSSSSLTKILELENENAKLKAKILELEQSKQDMSRANCVVVWPTGNYYAVYGDLTILKELSKTCSGTFTTGSWGDKLTADNIGHLFTTLIRKGYKRIGDIDASLGCGETYYKCQLWCNA